jgi:hypothetical protein
MLIGDGSCALQDEDDFLSAIAAPGFEDTLQFEDDELDAHPCMLPLVKLIEKAASLWRPGSAPLAFPESLLTEELF